METTNYGPVELLAIGFEAGEPPEGVVAAFVKLAAEETIVILDLILVRRTETGFDIVEFEEFADEHGFPAIELTAVGITAEEDVAEIAGQVEVGSSAIIAAVELTWARELTTEARIAGGELLYSTRIPANVVNEVVAEAMAAAQQEGAAS